MNIEALRALLFALPEVVEAPHHEMTSFRIQGKIFATMPADGTRLHLFIDDEDRERVTAIDPAFENLMWGVKVAGVRVDYALAHPSALKEMIYQSWRRKAPKRLAASTSSAWSRG